ncbi:ATP-binding protein [Streptomyces sp. NPDC059637]|uniref:ATP-binding protein n=1 Tax=Streptomyces sp. NPDC059637 TaxID=3347752 RepID=UPI0036AE46A8
MQDGRRPGRRVLERESQIAAVTGALTDLCGPEGDAAEGAAAGRGGLLVFAGPAGTGKTTLLAEVRRSAAARGCTVLFARGAEQEQHTPFHVVRQLLQPVLAAAGEDGRRELLGDWYGILGPAMGLMAAQEGTAPDPTGVRDGLDWVVTHLGVRRRPVVLVLDDAHWADAESLDWLAGYAPRAAELPMLVVLAHRPDEQPSHPAAFRAMTGPGGTRPHVLGPLTPAGVRALVREVLGEGADEEFCRQLWAVTGGNPFETVELAEKVREKGVEPRAGNTAALRDLASQVKGAGLLDRLERLGGAAKRFAWAAAVLAPEVSPAAAAGLAGLGPTEAAHAVEQLRGARILTPVPDADRPRAPAPAARLRAVPDDGLLPAPDGGGKLEFVHPLIAGAVYRSIPHGFRVAMHGQAAVEVLDAGLGATAAARHLLEMHPEGDPWVVRRLREAAREHMGSGAPEAARRCLARALREPPAPEDRGAVLLELGRASLLHEPATTINHLRAALEEPLLAPALRETVASRLAQALAHTDRMAEAVATVADAARHATDAPGRLRMRAEQFMWSAFSADEEDAPARSRRLARLADRITGRTRAHRHILGLRAWDAVVRGEPADTALHFAERALGDGLDWACDDWGYEVPLLVASTFMYCDRPGRSEEQFLDGIAAFERRGWRGGHLASGYTLLGYLKYRRGRLAEAEDFARTGLEIAERMGTGRLPVEWYAVGTLVVVLLARGRTEEAHELAREHGCAAPFPAAVTFPDAQAVHGELLLALGRHRDAARHLEEVGRRLEARGTRNPAWCRWQLDHALALAPDHPDRARDVAADAVRRARAFGTAGGIGQALRAAAAVAPPAEAVRLLDEAVARLEQSPAAHELAVALVDHGTALRRAGRVHEAAEQLYRGMEAAAACGADGLVRRARGELTAAGLRPRRLRTPQDADLTEAERAVAVRAARGTDNAGIARELRLREQAVVRLLSAVFAKTGTDRAGLSRALEP